MSRRRRQHVLSIAAALGGLFLFVWAARRAGVSEVLDGIRRVGWGLIPLIVLAGLRFVVRAEAWRLCTSGGRRLSRRQAFTAFLAGDALGNVTPLGWLASEPTKVLLTRHHLATSESISSLAIDNLLYACSTVVLVAVAGVVMLVTVPLPFEWQESGGVALGVLVAASAGAAWVLRGGSGLGAVIPLAWRERLIALRTSVFESSSREPLHLWRALLFDFAFHALAIAEAYLSLQWLLGSASPTLREAFLFEALNRVITVAFKFVPFRVGVDEASSGALAPLLGMDPVVGVSLAVVRKVRNLFWAAVGMSVIAVRHGQAAPATDRL
jgi:lysylphosphatidylglycerol synthase-like protein